MNHSTHLTETGELSQGLDLNFLKFTILNLSEGFANIFVYEANADRGQANDCTVASNQMLRIPYRAEKDVIVSMSSFSRNSRQETLTRQKQPFEIR
jgi:hypothetical protein